MTINTQELRGIGRAYEPVSHSLSRAIVEAADTIDLQATQLAAYPADWRSDSSLETWFPLTAEQLKAQAAEIARLKAAQIWQPIETAPKDGRTILLGGVNSHGAWHTMLGQWMSAEYIAESWEDPDGVEPGWFETAVEAEDPPNCWSIEPTHWMPLPAAPGTLQEKSNG